jgi:hypothetical protein
MRVVERPVAMNEAENGASVHLTKKPVILSQSFAELVHFANERVALLIVMMEMDFNIPNAQAGNVRYPLKKIVPVFLLGIEEAVLRGLAIGVSWGIQGNAGPTVAPTRDSAEGLLNRGSHSERFVVVRDGYPDAVNLCGVGGPVEAAL